MLESIRQKYGTFVRTGESKLETRPGITFPLKGETVKTDCIGPGEITIFHPAAFEAMDGTSNKNTRSDWYDLVHPRISLIFSRDEKSSHGDRHVWSQALSNKCKYMYCKSWLEAEI